MIKTILWTVWFIIIAILIYLYNEDYILKKINIYKDRLSIILYNKGKVIIKTKPKRLKK